MLLGETPKADSRCQLLYLNLHYTFTAASKGKCQYSVLQGYNVRNVFRQLFHTPAVPTSTPSPHHTSWTSITKLSVTQSHRFEAADTNRRTITSVLLPGSRLSNAGSLQHRPLRSQATLGQVRSRQVIGLRKKKERLQCLTTSS